MGEAKRHKLDGEPQRFVNIEHAVTQFADSVLHGGRDTPTIAVGPVVWNIEAGHDRKHWYFMVASTDAAGKFRTDQLKIANDDKPLAEETRAALVLAFVNRRHAVIHDFNDELTMARFCEALWPCDKTHRLRASVEQERGL